MEPEKIVTFINGNILSFNSAEWKTNYIRVSYNNEYIKINKNTELNLIN